jgi:hypothetical protein
MTAPLVTLVFLIALWSFAKMMIDMIAADGSKIAAALRGQSLLAHPPQVTRPVSVRYQPRAGSVRRPVHVTPEWRAAA